MKTLLATVITNDLSNNGLAIESKNLAKVSDEGDWVVEKRIAENGERGIFGFNGQEKSPEIADGHTNAKFWEYDSRSVKRWNTDPVFQPHQSPYNMMDGNPILYSNPLGDVIEILGDKKFKARTSFHLFVMRVFAPKEIRQMIKKLRDTDVTYYIAASSQYNRYQKSKNTIEIQQSKEKIESEIMPSKKSSTDWIQAKPIGALANELSHAYDDETNVDAKKEGTFIDVMTGTPKRIEEERSNIRENLVRKSLLMKQREEKSHQGWATKSPKDAKQAIKTIKGNEKIDFKKGQLPIENQEFVDRFGKVLKENTK